MAKSKKRRRRKYSGRRLRFVAFILTLATLAAFALLALLIYHTLGFTALVDQRLRGESTEKPTWVYARELEIRPGQRLTRDELVALLNDLGYRQEDSLGDAPGTFALAGDGLELRRRGDTAARIGVDFEKLWVSRIRELRTGAALDRVRFEPVPVTTLFGEDRAKQRWVPLEEIPRPTWPGPSSPPKIGAFSTTRGSTPSVSRERSQRTSRVGR